MDMPALLIAFVIVAGIQPGLAGGQNGHSFRETRELLQQYRRESEDRFQLYTGCLALWLSVGLQGDAAKAIGLTEDRLRITAESRLRAARLYMSAESAPEDPEALEAISLMLRVGPMLVVEAAVVDRAFSVNVELLNHLSDPASEEMSQTTTWRTRSIGTHGRNAGYIVQNVSEKVDKFLVEYMRVNEQDCPR